MSDMTNAPRTRLILPFLGPFYRGFAQPVGWLAFRITIGGLLMVEGWPKITAPFAMAGFVESIGFTPGWLFSPLLALLNFVGGAMIMLGLLTRPVALGNAVMLAVTLWFHMTRPYDPEPLLTPEGIEFLKTNLQYLTANGQARLTDGGIAFLHQVQGKAVFNSVFWTAGAALIAAFGGGRLSLDHMRGKEF
ncbi:MAG: DoxX family protein [Gemmobacter sp.]|nr:DoxX family protein [Gemmobacter sp.]